MDPTGNARKLLAPYNDRIDRLAEVAERLNRYLHMKCDEWTDDKARKMTREIEAIRSGRKLK